MNGLVSNFTKYWHFKSGLKAKDFQSVNMYFDGYPRIQKPRRGESGPI